VSGTASGCPTFGLCCPAAEQTTDCARKLPTDASALGFTIEDRDGAASASVQPDARSSPSFHSSDSYDTIAFSASDHWWSNSRTIIVGAAGAFAITCFVSAV